MSNNKSLINNGRIQIEGSSPSNYKARSDSYDKFKALMPTDVEMHPTISSVPPRNGMILGSMADSHDRDIFGQVVEKIRGTGVILSPHDVPDADAFGAAFTINNFLWNEGIRSSIVAERMIPNTDLMLYSLGMSPSGWSAITDDDHRPIIALDTNSSNTLRSINGRRNRIILSIDHHHEDDAPLDTEYRIINPAARSTCAIVASLIHADKIDSRMALALTAGITSDTQRLVTADDDTLRLFRRLRRMSKTPRHRIDELAFPPLKRGILANLIQELASIRCIVYRDRVVAVCQTAIKPPAIMVTLMREMDIDIAAALTPLSPNRFQLSLRVNQKNALDYGIKAYELARLISRKCGLPPQEECGGHDDMAGGSLPGQYEDIAEKIMEAIHEAIDKIHVKEK